ncbi:Protein of unknown function, partial [Gryllus bimaculatus]
MKDNTRDGQKTLHRRRMRVR